MKTAVTLAGVHTHTHTSSFIEIKIDIDKKIALLGMQFKHA